MRFSLACLSIGLLATGLGDAAILTPNRLMHKRLFQSTHHYAKFTAASIPTGGCPNPPNGAHVVAYINEPSTDTQATIFRDDKRKEIIFAAPGTASARDYEIDGNYTQVPYDSPGVHCGDCMVHGGFLDAWNSIAKQTHRIIHNTHKRHKRYKIVTTGHSLGGAIAALAFSSLSGLHLPVKAGYTFGQPRIGNQAFANHLDRVAHASERRRGKLVRVTHAADPVPNEPGSDGGYWRHSRTEFWEAGKTVQNAHTSWRCYGQESPTCSMSQQGAPDGNDHLLYSNVHFDNAYPYCGL